MSQGAGRISPLSAPPGGAAAARLDPAAPDDLPGPRREKATRLLWCSALVNVSRRWEVASRRGRSFSVSCSTHPGGCRGMAGAAPRAGGRVPPLVLMAAGRSERGWKQRWRCPCRGASACPLSAYTHACFLGQNRIRTSQKSGPLRKYRFSASLPAKYLEEFVSLPAPQKNPKTELPKPATTKNANTLNSIKTGNTLIKRVLLMDFS